jgi:hypothetical protein
LRILPWLFELNIGGYAAPWELPVTRSGGWPVMRAGMLGKVDRVDVVLEGSNECPTLVGVLVRDYKASTGSHMAKLRGGTAFQLPVYGLAVKDSLGAGSEIPLAGFFIHAPRPAVVSEDDPGRIVSDARFLTPNLHQRLGYKTNKNSKEPGALVNGLVQNRLGRLFAAMEEGFFHPELVAGSRTACGYCHLASVCAVRRGQQDLLATAGTAGVSMAANNGVAPYFASPAEMRADTGSETGDE